MDNKIIRKKLRLDLHKQELLKVMSKFTLFSLTENKHHREVMNAFNPVNKRLCKSIPPIIF